MKLKLRYRFAVYVELDAEGPDDLVLECMADEDRLRELACDNANYFTAIVNSGIELNGQNALGEVDCFVIKADNELYEQALYDIDQDVRGFKN